MIAVRERQRRSGNAQERPIVVATDRVEAHEATYHSLDDINFDDPGIQSDLQAVFAVLAEIGAERPTS